MDRPAEGPLHAPAGRPADAPVRGDGNRPRAVRVDGRDAPPGGRPTVVRPGGSPASRAAPAAPRAIVVHGVSHVAELAYRDRLERLASSPARVRYVPVVSRPSHPDNAGWIGLTGRLDAQLDAVCDAHRLDPAASVAYLCGNPEMIATAERILARRGFAPDAIVSEHYWPLA